MFRYRQTQRSQKRLENRFAELLKPFAVSSNQMTGPAVEPAARNATRQVADDLRKKTSERKHVRSIEQLAS